MVFGVFDFQSLNDHLKRSFVCRLYKAVLILKHFPVLRNRGEAFNEDMSSCLSLAIQSLNAS